MIVIPKIYINARKNLNCSCALYNGKCKLNMSECPIKNHKQKRTCTRGIIYCETVCKENLNISYNGKLRKAECSYIEKFDGINIYGLISYGDYDMLYDTVNHDKDIILSSMKNIIVPNSENQILLDKIRRYKINRMCEYKTVLDDETDEDEGEQNGR